MNIASASHSQLRLYREHERLSAELAALRAHQKQNREHKKRSTAACFVRGCASGGPFFLLTEAHKLDECELREQRLERLDADISSAPAATGAQGARPGE